MRSIAVVALSLAALPALTPAAHAEGVPAAASRACANVAFTPNSDDVAAYVRVQGVSCKFARAFIRGSGGRPGKEFRFFTCSRRSVDEPEGLPYKRYRCVRNGDVIRWRRY